MYYYFLLTMDRSGPHLMMEHQIVSGAQPVHDFELYRSAIHSNQFNIYTATDFPKSAIRSCCQQVSQGQSRNFLPLFVKKIFGLVLNYACRPNMRLNLFSLNRLRWAQKDCNSYCARQQCGQLPRSRTGLELRARQRIEEAEAGPDRLVGGGGWQ